MIESSYKFSYIIGYRHNYERYLNLIRTLSWLKSFSDIEIIIVEQDNKPKLKISDVNYYFVQCDTPFNKSQTFNIGTAYATTDIICFGDCDLIMDQTEFINALKLLEQYECVSPYSSVLDLQQNEVGMGLELLKNIKRHGRGENDHQKIPLCGGIIFFRRDAINTIKGWDENFVGWGGEDDWQSHKVKMFLTYHEVPNRCYHLYHTRLQPDMSYYYKNLTLLNNLAKLSKDDVVKMLNEN